MWISRGTSTFSESNGPTWITFTRSRGIKRRGRRIWSRGFTMFLNNWTSRRHLVLERINRCRWWLRRTLVETWSDRDIGNIVVNHGNKEKQRGSRKTVKQWRFSNSKVTISTRGATGLHRNRGLRVKTGRWSSSDSDRGGATTNRRLDGGAWAARAWLERTEITRVEARGLSAFLWYNRFTFE